MQWSVDLDLSDFPWPFSLLRSLASLEDVLLVMDRHHWLMRILLDLSPAFANGPDALARKHEVMLV